MAQLPAVSASSCVYIMSCFTPGNYKNASAAELRILSQAVITFLNALTTSIDLRIVAGFIDVAVATSPVCALAMDHIWRHQREFTLFLVDSSRFIIEECPCF